ncbi:MAG: GntR family transcriptional regulator [Acidimicrobiales bacterium]
MLIRVDDALPITASEQIRSQVRRIVASGQAPPGTQLPTIRQLASDLGLARGTVERAYDLLEADGIVEGRGRAGTFLRAAPVRRATTAERRLELERSADALVIAARQLGADDDEVRRALERALGRLP